jgi:hypothetical protein
MAHRWPGRKIDAVRQELRITPIVLSPLFRLTHETTMLAEFIGSTDMVVADPTGIVEGTHMVITDAKTGAFHITDAIADPVGNAVIFDTPLGFSFDDGSHVTIAEHDMQLPIGTLADPVIYQARVPVAVQSENAFDVHRLMITALTATSAADLALFGDGPALVNGLVLRKKNHNGTYWNIGNAKTNGDLMGMMFDFRFLDNVGLGTNGFSGRFSMDKMGGIVRLGKGDDLELLVQDDLTTRVLRLGLLAEGGVSDEQY